MKSLRYYKAILCVECSLNTVRACQPCAEAAPSDSDRTLPNSKQSNQLFALHLRSYHTPSIIRINARTWETFAYSVKLTSGAELCEDKAKEIQQSELICRCEERDYFQVKQVYLCCLISIIVFTFLWYDLQFAPIHWDHLQFYLTSITLTEYFIVYSLIYSVLRRGDSGGCGLFDAVMNFIIGINH